MFSTLYTTILFQPLLNLLVGLYDLLGHDMGWAIIVMTVIIRLILYPSFKHQLESQKKLAELQPKLQTLKDKHKDDKEAQSRAMMEFYKENKVNPLSSCLPLVIQLVILIALFQVFRTGLNGATVSNLYSFVPNPGTISPTAFGSPRSANALLPSTSGSSPASSPCNPLPPPLLRSLNDPGPPEVLRQCQQTPFLF